MLGIEDWGRGKGRENVMLGVVGGLGGFWGGDDDVSGTVRGYG